MKKEKLVLIDGHSILNRAFYGVPDLTNSEGLHTNAVYGFLNILFKIMDEEEPDYLIVAFDLSAPTFRHKMYEEYKGTRKPMLPELREQVPVIKDVLHAMNITTCELEGYEADDIIGTLSLSGQKQDMDVSVVSGDRDLLQLASDVVQIRIPKTRGGKTEIENYYAKDVEERYEVTPTEFIDLKALMGDSSDNIPGVPGIGEKTATKIITAFHSIENAHEHVEEITPNRARTMMKEHYDLAELSKTLATIDREVELPCKITDGVLQDLFNEQAHGWISRLEFKSLLKRFDQQLKTNGCEQEFLYLNDFALVEQFLDEGLAAPVRGIGVISQGRREEDFLGISLSIPQGKDQVKTGYIPVLGFATREYLKEKLGELVLQGKTYVQDVKTMLHLTGGSFRSAELADCMIAAYLLNPLKDSYHTDDLARDFCGLSIQPLTDLKGKGLLSDVAGSQPEAFLAYACYEAYIPFLAGPLLMKELQNQEMKELYDNIEMPLVYELYAMEQAGVQVQAEELHGYSELLGSRIGELEGQIYQLAGETFNINSPKQLGEVLFSHLEIPGGKKTKTGYSTAADVLEKLAPEYPVIDQILSYRQYTKLKSTYTDGLAGYIGEDGRIHGTFNQTITATGRISSTEPNLQNIPIRTELGRPLRKAFVPREGCVFVDADYSQIELRILAHLSGDEHLIQAYHSAQDIHRATAAQVFHTPLDQVTDQQRRNAKAVNFGIVYGISSFGLSQGLSISRKEAEKYINQYFESYPGVKEFLDRMVKEGKEKGYATTMFGRRRPLPELHSGNYMQRMFGERVAMNAPIQGTAADIIKIAMIRVANALRQEELQSRIVLQIHDELLVEAPVEEQEQVMELMKREMSQAAQMSVDLIVDVQAGQNWLEAH